MLDYESQRKLIIVFILGVTLTIIATITALVFIWLPDNSTEEEESFEVGKVTSTSSSEESVVQRYYKELYVLFLNSDIDSIYDLTAKDYLKYNNMNKEQLRQFLANKGVLSRGLNLEQYKNYKLPGYSNVYELDMKVKNQAYSINVVIREVSPENYTIAFDMFVDYEEDVYNKTLNSIEMDIQKRIRYTNSVQYEFKLTNNYDKDVTINSESAISPIILVNSQNQTKQPIMTNMAAAQFVVAPKQSRNCTAVFKMEDSYDHYYYNKLVVKGVGFSGMSGTTNLEFNLT